MELHGKENFNSLYYKRLFEGIRELRQMSIYPATVFEEWEKAESSHKLFIGCSDSRVVPKSNYTNFPERLFL